MCKEVEVKLQGEYSHPRKFKKTPCNRCKHFRYVVLCIQLIDTGQKANTLRALEEWTKFELDICSIKMEYPKESLL